MGRFNNFQKAVRMANQDYNRTITKSVLHKKLRLEILDEQGLDGLICMKSIGDDFTFTFPAPLSASEETALDAVIDAHDDSPIPVARIYDFIQDFQDPLSTDFGIIGLYKKQWEIDKGKRIKREYMEDGTQNAKVVVRDVYTYTFVQDLQGNDTTQIDNYTRKIEWLMPDDSVAFSKVVSTQQSDGYINRINREVRQGQIDKLMQDGNQLRVDAANLDPNDFPDQATYEAMRDGFIAVADALDVLWLHYETQIDHHINLGGTGLWDAVDGETVQAILDILAIVVDQNTLRTVKDNIENQIT